MSETVLLQYSICLSILALLKINFGRPPNRECSSLEKGEETEELKAWDQVRISGADTKVFNFKLGQSGGARGYAGITSKFLNCFLNDKCLLFLDISDQLKDNMHTLHPINNTLRQRNNILVLGYKLVRWPRYHLCSHRKSGITL